MKKKQKDQYYIGQRKEMLDFIPKDAGHILEIGCGQGNFGEWVKQKIQTDYWAVELNPDMAQIAAGKLDRVLVGNFLEQFDQLPKQQFDCIVFNDVLEHFTDPWHVLNSCKSLLSDRGVIVASIPNVRFISNLLKLLLLKDWKYVNAGILDRTHYRFFTKKSIVRMFKECHYQMIKMKGVNRCIVEPFSFIFNVCTLFFFQDSLYMQYACVASPDKQPDQAK